MLTLLFIALLASPSPSAATSPAAIAAPQATRLSAPCEEAARGVAAVVADPSITIVASYPQGFVIALHAISSAGFGWRLRLDPANAAVAQLTNTVNISDLLDGSLSQPKAPPLVGGGGTQYFLFRVERNQLAVAEHQTPPSTPTMTFTFDEFGPGDPTVIQTRSFHVSIVPNHLVC